MRACGEQKLVERRAVCVAGGRQKRQGCSGLCSSARQVGRRCALPATHRCRAAGRAARRWLAQQAPAQGTHSIALLERSGRWCSCTPMNLWRHLLGGWERRGPGAMPAGRRCWQPAAGARAQARSRLRLSARRRWARRPRPATTRPAIIAYSAGSGADTGAGKISVGGHSIGGGGACVRSAAGLH
jgi:uncharacterized membrane protein YgcG